MKVSVILTTHGKSKYLNQAIASVLTQTFQDFELCIAYDGAIEQIPSINDERICFFAYYTIPPDVVNRYAYTINQTLPKTTGEYITYLCHDDLFLPWRLEGFAYVLDRNPDIHVVYGSQQIIKEENGHTFLNGCRETCGVTFAAPGRINHSSVMHRRSCLEQVVGWEEKAPMRYGDAYFWNRLHAAGYAFHPVEAVMDVYRENPKSVTYLIDHPEENDTTDTGLAQEVEGRDSSAIGTSA